MPACQSIGTIEPIPGKVTVMHSGGSTGILHPGPVVLNGEVSMTHRPGSADA